MPMAHLEGAAWYGCMIAFTAGVESVKIIRRIAGTHFAKHGTVWGAAVGGNGGNGGNVTQVSDTNQTGSNNSGTTARLRLLFVPPADGSAMLHVCSKAGVEKSERVFSYRVRSAATTTQTADANGGNGGNGKSGMVIILPHVSAAIMNCPLRASEFGPSSSSSFRALRSATRVVLFPTPSIL